MTTAQVDWVAIYNAPTITWEFRERPPAGGGGAIAAEMVKAGLVSQADIDTFSSQNIIFRDDMWTKAAVHILKQHRPNVLLFHLLTLDSIQHRYGPRTPAAMATMALLDSQVASIVRTLEETGLAATTTLFVAVGPRVQGREASDPAERRVAQGRPARGGGREGREDAGVHGARGRQRARIRHRAGCGGRDPRADQAGARGLEGIDKIIEPADYGSTGCRCLRQTIRWARSSLRRKRGMPSPEPRSADRHRCSGRQPWRARLCLDRSRSAVAVHRVGARHQAGRRSSRPSTTSMLRRRRHAFSGSS